MCTFLHFLNQMQPVSKYKSGVFYKKNNINCLVGRISHATLRLFLDTYRQEVNQQSNTFDEQTSC